MVIPTQRNHRLALLRAWKNPCCAPAAWRDKQTAGPTFSWFGTTKSVFIATHGPGRLVRDHGRAALLLRFRQSRRHVAKRCDMLVYVGFRMLDRDGPLLIPPVRLSHYAAVDHAKPVVPP